MVSSKPTRIQPHWPPVDEHLVAPGTRYEMYDGELVYVPPAHPSHATRHIQVGALIEAHVHPGFEVACELLTRVSWYSDIAPDVSVYPHAPDPVTGGRQLEHLAFEIVSTQKLNDAGRKAALLAARGVRRVFAVDIPHARVLEWSAALDSWSPLAPTASIHDPVLAVPLPLELLVRAINTDDAIARALLAKHNPVLEAGAAAALAEGQRRGLARGRKQGLADGKRRGLQRGKAEALLVLLAARGFAPGAADRRRILGERDPAQLDRWIARAASAATLAEALRRTEVAASATGEPARRKRGAARHQPTASRLPKRPPRS